MQTASSAIHVTIVAPELLSPLHDTRAGYMHAQDPA